MGAVPSRRPAHLTRRAGRPVKIWGFFANGRLEYHVLPRDGQRTTNMNARRYQHLVSQKFAKWRPSGENVSLESMPPPTSPTPAWFSYTFSLVLV